MSSQNLREKLTTRYLEMKKRSEFHQFNDEVKLKNEGFSVDKIQKTTRDKLRILKSLSNMQVEKMLKKSN